MKRHPTTILMALCFGVAGALGLAAAFVTLEDALRPGHPVTRHFERTVPAGGRPVRVEGQLTRLDVEAGPDGVVGLAADITSWLPDGDSREAATGGSAPGDIEVIETEDRILIRHHQSERRVAGLLSISLDEDAADLRLRVPRGTTLEIDNRYGAIGVRDVSGPVAVQSASGGITITGAAGPVTVENSYGDIELEHVRGAVTVTNASGAIAASDIEGDARLETRYGGIDVRGLHGDLEAVSESGSVTASDVTGDVRARCSYGDVQADRIGGRLNVDGASVDVEARRIGAGAEISTTYGRIELDGAGGPVRLRDRNGPVEVRGLFGAALTAQHRVETSYARIDFGWPRGRAVSYDLESTYGTIASDLPGVSSEKGSRDALSGSVGEGEARISLVSENGDIRLEEEESE